MIGYSNITNQKQNNMEFKVTEVIDAVPAQWGKQRVSFKVDGNPNRLSGFFMHPPKVGDTLHGEVVQKGSYWNFNFGTKAPPMQTTGNAELKNLIEFKVMAKLDRIEWLLEKSLGMATEEKVYPEMNGTNDASGFDVMDKNNPF